MCTFLESKTRGSVVFLTKFERIGHQSIKSMSLRISLALLVLTVFTVLTSCKKNDPPQDPVVQDSLGTVKMSFSHHWENTATPFQMETEFIHSTTGDTLTFHTLKYYVTNLKLKNSDGSWWSESESYYLLDLTVPSSIEFVMDSVPCGNYTDLAFTIGVDSLHNVSGAQAGALSVTNDMFWGWNTGYIMIKAEGSSPNSGGGDYFIYHLAGYSGDYNVVKEHEYNLGSVPLTVKNDKTVSIDMGVDIAHLFNTMGSVNSNYMVSTVGLVASKMAKDFNNGLVFIGIHN